MDFGRVELYARKLGWLNSAPDKDYKPPKQKTRFEVLSISETYAHAKELPEIKGVEYLVNWMTEVGLYKQSGFGLVPVDWVDIKAWAEMTGTRFTAEEALALMAASRAYCAEYSQGSNPQRVAPDDERGYGYSPEVVSANVDANIMVLIKERDKNKASK